MKRTGTATPALTLAVLGLCACEAPGPTPEGLCAGATASVVAGARLVLPRGDVEEITGAQADAWLEGDTLVVRGPGEPGTYLVDVSCPTGRATIELDVTPLRFSPVATWTADEEAGVPGGREYFAAWTGLDDDRGLYLYGGFSYEPQFTPTDELFRFDLATSTWQSVAATSTTGALPPPGGRVARGPGADAASIYYLGGANLATDGSLETPPTFMRLTTTTSGGEFAPVDADDTVGSYTGALVFDEKRGRFLSVCGVDSEVLGIHCEVRAIPVEGGAWQTLAVADSDGAPGGRFGFHHMLDEENDRLVVYGGQTGGANLALDGEAWALELAEDPPRWTQLASGLPRRNGAWAEDPVHHRLIIWGGTPDGSSAHPGLDILTLDRGHEAWVHVDVGGESDGAPPPRASGQCIRDDAERRLLCGFGNSLAGVFTDLWALPLATD